MRTSAADDLALSRHERPAVLDQSRSGRGAKRDRAVALLDEDDNALSVQVPQEFYVQATRPTRRAPG
jgi:hypothetical protein